MKSKLIFSLFFFITVLISAQKNEQQTINNSFTTFFNQLKNKQIDQAVENIYPKYYTFASKDQMKMILNMTYNNPMIKVEVQNFKVNKIGNPDLVNGEYFSVVDYSTRVRFGTENLQEEMRKNIQNMLVQKYGQGNVIYYENEMAYFINGKSKACAVSKDKKNWKFVLVEKEMKGNLDKILPKKVLDKF